MRANEGRPSGQGRSADARETLPAPPQEMPSVTLYAGQFVARREPHMVTTVLGSCVSVCLFDAGARVGGVNHFMLPHWVSPDAEAALRYGNAATLRLLRAVEALGARRRHLRAKIVGGACMLSSPDAAGGLGARNVAVARAVLSAEGVGVVADDVGGTLGRRLVFHTGDGTAWVRTVGG